MSLEVRVGMEVVKEVLSSGLRLRERVVRVGMETSGSEVAGDLVGLEVQVWRLVRPLKRGDVASAGWRGLGF